MVPGRRCAARDAFLTGCGPVRWCRSRLSPHAEIRAEPKWTRCEERQSKLRRFSPAPRLLPAHIVALTASVWTRLPVASADLGAERPETFVAHLATGGVCVGWTTQIDPARSQFHVGPGIRHVCGWDLDWRESRFATSSITRRLWTLQGTTSGMGLRMRLTGTQPVHWERPR